MKNIISYVKESGGQSFAERRFNEVDSLVFSYLVYYELNGIVPPPKARKQITVAEAGTRYLQKRGTSQFNVNSALIREMAAAPRFCDVQLSDYTELFRIGRAQFAALHAVLPGGTDVLMVRGADNSLTSWQEAFAISYCETPSQKMALLWMQRLAEKYGTSGMQNLILTGHSKGGNTLLYAAVHSSPSLSGRIRRIYLNDCPGLTPGLYEEAALAALQDKIIRITPEYSLIGQLFEHAAPDYIVACSTSGINQHEPLFWMVEGNHFVPAAARTPESRKLALGVNRWIASADFKERKAFSRDLFRTLRQARANGAQTVPEPKASRNIDDYEAGRDPAADPDGLSEDPGTRKTAAIILQFLLNASGPSRRAARKLAGAFYVTNMHALARKLAALIHR
ncbi:MAG: DUF2974 domain-containing protein [Eubacterium sp.]|nr:DUF2974 domain-containing protein [Eubacterium sp.]